MTRITIYPKEIAFLTGKSERYGREVIRKIKHSLNKKSHQLVTIDECCQYLGIDKQHVESRLSLGR